jgi:bis(5'-nucleosyl)-tetraphosphatase (symmetrical)
MSTYAIGDVQGCYEPLCRLLEKIAFDHARDELWFVGDLVNRGPDSLGVLRRVIALGDPAVVVLGNHDLHLLAIARGGAHFKPGDESLHAVLDAPDRERLLDWLQSRPLLHHDAQIRCTMIHAALPPQWTLAIARRCAAEVERELRGEQGGDFLAHMYGDQPDLWRDDLDAPERMRFTVNCLTRLRVVDREGRLHLRFKGPLHAMPAHLVPWFRSPRRRTRDDRIVCGHWSALGYFSEENVLGLDTGCVWGGMLTAQRIDVASTPVSIANRSGGLPVGGD